MPGHTPSRSGRLLLICCLVCFSCFLAAYMRMPLFPLHAVSLGADSVQVGMLNALFMFLAGALCVPAGIWSDVVGRRLPILGGILILSLSALLLAASQSVLQMAGICLLAGVGMAIFAPPLMSYVADVTPVDRLGSAFGWYTTSLYAAMTVGPALGGLLGRSIGYRPVFLGSGIMLFLIFWVVLFFLPPSRPRDPAPAKRVTLRQVLELLRSRRLVVCLVTMLGSCIGYGMFLTFMPLYARHLGLDAAHVGWLFAAQALANTLCRIPLGRLGDRVADRSFIATAGLAGFTLSLVALGLAGSFLTLVLGALLFGATLGTAFTALVALTTEAAPREMRGLALGLYNSCVYFGMMLSSALMGGVVRGFGYGAAFLVCAALTLMVALFFASLHRVTVAGDGASDGAPCRNN